MKQSSIAQAVRRSFRDNMMTFDSASQMTMDSIGGRQYPVAAGRTLDYGNSAGGSSKGVRTHDGRWVDSTGAFLVGELERLDPTMHNPLAEVSWSRDIDLREDVTIADEVSSFTLTTYGSAGGLGAGNAIRNGKAWIGKATDQITGIGIDLAKIPTPLTPWGMELKFTILELESAAKLGRPIDQQKFEGMTLKHQMDVDEMVYVGDTGLGLPGLVNATVANAGLVTNVGNVVQGVSQSTTWALKTPLEILNDINTAINSVWAASGYAILPGRILLPPAQYGSLMVPTSLAGNASIMKYVQENNVFSLNTGRKLEIYPTKWCVGAGVGGVLGTAGGVDRMVVYTKDKMRVRYPMTLLQRTPIQYTGIYHASTYFCRLGGLEIVYNETIGYFDGI